MARVGYACVSTIDQDTALQVLAPDDRMHMVGSTRVIEPHSAGPALDNRMIEIPALVH